MDYKIQTIKAENDAIVASIIQSVGIEFGAVGEGFGPSDDEVLKMSEHYTLATRSLYLVALINNRVVGGCGLAALNQSSETCELKKLFLLPEARGKGIGKQLTNQCLQFAIEQGYQRCYLDTLKTMTVARSLYEQLGFTYLSKPIEGDVHYGCDIWMMKSLMNA